MADLSITVASVALITGTKITGTSGATLTAGMPIYIDSNNAVQKCLNTTAALAACVGITLNAALSGQPITYAAQGAIVAIGATVVVGAPYVVSANAGGIAPEADIGTAFVTQIGRATTTARLQLDLIQYGVAHG